MAIGRQTMSYSYHIIGVQFPNSREYSVSPRWVMSSYKKREFQLCRNAKKTSPWGKENQNWIYTLINILSL